MKTNSTDTTGKKNVSSTPSKSSDGAAAPGQQRSTDTKTSQPGFQKEKTSQYESDKLNKKSLADQSDEAMDETRKSSDIEEDDEFVDNSDISKDDRDVDSGSKY